MSLTGSPPPGPDPLLLEWRAFPLPEHPSWYWGYNGLAAHHVAVPWRAYSGKRLVEALSHAGWDELGDGVGAFAAVRIPTVRVYNGWFAPVVGMALYDLSPNVRDVNRVFSYLIADQDLLRAFDVLCRAEVPEAGLRAFLHAHVGAVL